jgi:hypothetical protein
MKSQLVTFKQLVDSEYTAKGDGLTDAFMAIRGVRNLATGEFVKGCGLSLGTLRKAYHGTEIDKDSIGPLVEWFSRTHPLLSLDVVALERAPQLKRKKRLLHTLRLRDVAREADGCFLVRLAPANDVAPEDVYAELVDFIPADRKEAL